MPVLQWNAGNIIDGVDAILVKILGAQWSGMCQGPPIPHPKGCILPFVLQRRDHNASWASWGSGGTYSRGGSTAPAPMLGRAQGYLPALNVTGTAKVSLAGVGHISGGKGCRVEFVASPRGTNQVPGVVK